MEQQCGFPTEWIGCVLTEVETAKLRLPNQKAKNFVDGETLDSCLHKQWIRKDLLGMPMQWDDLTLIIPKKALERVKDELEGLKIPFSVEKPIDPKKLALSIEALEGNLESKRRQLQDIRENCEHVWEKYDGKDEDGTVLFENEICEICGEVKS